MSAPEYMAPDRAEPTSEDLARHAARRRVPLALIQREQGVAFRLRALAAEVPDALNGARGQITLTATAIEYGLETPRELVEQLRDHARSSHTASVLLPQAHPSKALFARRATYLEQAAFLVDPLVEQPAAGGDL